VLDNNAGSMPYIDLKKLEAKVALSLVQTVRGNKKGIRSEGSKRRAGPERHKRWWAIQQTATFWEWYVRT